MNKEKVLLCFGNSITEGWGVRHNESWPSLIQRSLPFQVHNAGISGETSADGLRRVEDTLAARPTWCIIEFGINDFFNGFSTEQTRANIEKIIKAMKDHDIVPALMGFNLPYKEAGEWHRTFIALGEEHELPVMPDLFSGLWGKEGVFMPDGLHPTAKGYRIIAEACLETFNGVLWPAPATLH